MLVAVPVGLQIELACLRLLGEGGKPDVDKRTVMMSIVCVC